MLLSNTNKVGSYFGSKLSASEDFDLKGFWDNPDNDKNKLILDAIHQTSIRCSEKLNWDNEPFIRAYEQVMERKLTILISYMIKLPGINKNLIIKQGAK